MRKETKRLKSQKIISVDEAAVKDKVNEVVRDTVEETLNELLDQEAEHLCNAKKYECREDRQGTRAGYYQRSLETKAGEVRLNVPKLRTLITGGSGRIAEEGTGGGEIEGNEAEESSEGG